MSKFSFVYFSWGWTKLSRLDLSIMTPLFVDEIYWACLKGPVKMEEPAHNGTYRVLQIKWLQCLTDHFFRNKRILKVILDWKHILASLLRVRNELFSFTKHPVGGTYIQKNLLDSQGIETLLGLSCWIMNFRRSVLWMWWLNHSVEI